MRKMHASNKKRLFLWLVASTSLLICYLFFRLYKWESLSHNEFSLSTPKPSAQSVDERYWENPKLEKVFSKSFDSKILLYPLRLKVDKNGSIYILDVALRCVKQFSRTGDSLKTFGLGKGDGPGEFRSPFDFDIASNGDIYVSDNTKRTITIFDSLTQLRKIVKPKDGGNPSRVLITENKKLVVKTLSPGDFFRVYNLNGYKKVSFGNFLKYQQLHLLPIDITICDNRNKIYGAFIKAGYIFSFNDDGEMMFFKETMDNFAFPRLTFKKEGKSSSVYLDKKAPVVNWDISVDSYAKRNIIFILVGFASKEADESGLDDKVIIDAYSSDEGNYLFSFKVPRSGKNLGVISCKIKNNHLFLLELGEHVVLTKYKIRFD